MRIDKIKVEEIELETVTPFITSHSCYDTITRLFITLQTAEHKSISECAAFPDRSYINESREDVKNVLENQLIPNIKGNEYECVQDVIMHMDRLLEGYELSKASIEMGIWALKAQVQKQPLWKLLGGTNRQVNAMPVLGIKTSKQQIENEIQRFISQGYQYIKLKIKPGPYSAWIDAIVKQFPSIGFSLDANESFTLTQAMEQLTSLTGHYRYI